MSIDLQANTSVASRGSGLGTTSGNGTAVVCHRKSSSAAAGDLILELGMSGSTLRFSVGASDAVDYETGGGAQTPDNAATHADGTWGYYAIVVSGGAWAAYWYDDTGARTNHAHPVIAWRDRGRSRRGCRGRCGRRRAGCA